MDNLQQTNSANGFHLGTFVVNVTAVIKSNNERIYVRECNNKRLGDSYSLMERTMSSVGFDYE